MLHHLNHSPSVGTLLIAYRNSPAFSAEHQLPLTNALLINNAARTILIKLGKTTPIGHLSCYRTLMTYVFENYFARLTLEQRIELIFLGRIRFEFQFSFQKPQFAAARAMDFVLMPMNLSLGLFYPVITMIFMLFKFSPFIAKSAIVKTAAAKWSFICFYGQTAIVTVVAISLTFFFLGVILKTPIFPDHLRKKGAWIASSSIKPLIYLLFILNIQLLMLNSLFIKLNSLFLRRKTLIYEEHFTSTHRWLKNQFEPKISSYNVGYAQEKVSKAYLPELVEKWHQLTAP